MYHHLIEALTDLPLPVPATAEWITRHFSSKYSLCVEAGWGSMLGTGDKAANKTDLVSALLKFSPLDATAEPLFFKYMLLLFMILTHCFGITYLCISVPC